MKPNRRRIVVYVVCIVAGVVVPVAAALLLGLLGPSPYLLDEDALGPEWSSPRRFPDGSTPAPAEHARVLSPSWRKHLHTRS